MPADLNEPCARDGCTFLPLLELVGGRWLVPTNYCSDACADFMWLERTLATAPTTEATPKALEAMKELRKLLDGRQEPNDIGPLVRD